MNTFYFLGYETFKFNDNDLLKVYVLDFKNKIVHNIYKSVTKELISKLEGYKPFDNVTNLISFVIKRNGKITLDIK